MDAGSSASSFDERSIRSTHLQSGSRLRAIGNGREPGAREPARRRWDCTAAIGTAQPAARAAWSARSTARRATPAKPTPVDCPMRLVRKRVSERSALELRAPCVVGSCFSVDCTPRTYGYGRRARASYNAARATCLSCKRICEIGTSTIERVRGWLCSWPPAHAGVTLGQRHEHHGPMDRPHRLKLKLTASGLRVPGSEIA